jgi:Tautomerase enzyme
MPLLRFDVIEGRSTDELRVLLDTAHDIMVECFQVPARDRYQVVNEHPASRMIMQDTGLGLQRSEKMVLLQITSRPRARAAKETFYLRLVEALEAVCGISPSDVVVNFVINDDEDWSFGFARAQFLTGEL